VFASLQVQNLSHKVLQKYATEPDPDFASLILAEMMDGGIETKDLENCQHLIVACCRSFFLNPEKIKEYWNHFKRTYRTCPNLRQAQEKALEMTGVPPIFWSDVMEQVSPTEDQPRPFLVPRHRGLHLVVNNEPEFKRLAGNDRD
jgi:hypothetical protein